MRPLNDIMEFDLVIAVHADGSIVPDPKLYAPELFDGELMGSGWSGTEWSLMNGYSGQYGYSGPLMHQSEFIGGRMERDIRATPGWYVAIYDHPADDSDPTEWAVAYRPFTN